MGALDAHTHDHLKGVLHIGHIGGHTGDQAGGGIFVQVGKGEALDICKHSPAQVAGKAAAGLGSQASGAGAEKQGKHRHEHHQQTGAVHIGHVPLLHPVVDDGGHHQRDEHLHHHFQHHKDGREDGDPFEFPQMGKQCFEHRDLLKIEKYSKLLWS